VNRFVTLNNVECPWCGDVTSVDLNHDGSTGVRLCPHCNRPFRAILTCRTTKLREDEPLLVPSEEERAG
jgi:transposase InsO family protein